MIADQYIGPVLRKSITLNVLKSEEHGYNHWFRVWKNAQVLAKKTPGASLEIVALFALFHDSMRENDDDDPHHGLRGWELWTKFAEKDQLTQAQSNTLYLACVNHSNGFTLYDPTVGVCWDADRLDLPRVGITPDPDLMSTPTGKAIASRKIHIL